MNIRTTFNVQGSGRVVVTGAIGDYGRQHFVNKAGQPDKSANYEKLVLQKGSFVLNENSFNDAVPTPVFTKSTCSFRVGAKGAVPILKGTGAYAGISGTLKGVGTTAFVTGPSKKSPNGCGLRPKNKAFFGTVKITGSIAIAK